MDFFDILKYAVSLAGGAFVVWGSIKSDLADMKARIVILEKSVDKAHDRLDSVLEQGK